MHDDSVWPNNRPIGRWANAQQRCKRRYRYRTDLPLRRDAGRRRYGCGCPSDSRNRRNEIMLFGERAPYRVSIERYPLGIPESIGGSTRKREITR